LRQLVSEEAGNVREYFPCPHETQLSSELDATAVEYLPCTQLIQETIDTAPTVIEYVPALQVSQLPLPDIALNVPAGHATHSFSKGDCPGENPASHMQFVIAILPAIEDELW